MADAVPMVRREERRHLLMNGWLIAGFIIVGTAVTNERGIFRPLDVENAMSATARAFIAIAAPGQPGFRNIRSVSSLGAPTPNVRQRLIDAIDWLDGDPEPTGLNLASTPPDLGDMTVIPRAFSATPDNFGVPDAQNTPPPPALGQNPIDETGAVPEPGTWAMLVLGFGVLGTALRRSGALRRPSRTAPRRRKAVAQRA